MLKQNRLAPVNNAKSSITKQPAEGLFCMYNHRVCMQNRLEGYDFCLRHILEDKNAPFRQCSYTSSKSGKKCNNAAPKTDRKDGYCMEHSRRAILIRQRNSRKRRPKESPETMLEGLDHYASRGRAHMADSDSRKHPSLASKALEYASSSDSDAETPLVDQAWRGDCDSDAESVDSEQEDTLKHAGVYTAEEVAQVMRDKLIRLQSLYIDQFKRLQHVMKERRRKYLHTVGQEKETFGGVGQYAKDLDSQENWNRYTAMKRYHRRFGMEALLHRQSKERRIAASDSTACRAPAQPRCTVTQNGEKCPCRSLPLSKYCFEHILLDPHQVLYQPCSFGDGTCSQPVANSDDTPLCPLHARLTNSHDSTFGTDSKAEVSAADEVIDVTTESVAMETEPVDLSASEDPSNQGKQEDFNEEDLIKKGKLLFQHLKSSDASCSTTDVS